MFSETSRTRIETLEWIVGGRNLKSYMGRTHEDDDCVVFTLKCRGLTAQEYFGLYRVVLDEFEPGRIPRVKNPTQPFDDKTIHQIVVSVAASRIATYAGKKIVDKAADLLARFVEAKLVATSTTRPKKVTIYGPADKALYEVEIKEEKPKRR